MSDFDKEAEREKLRKKFEKEEQKREATEQMSELLLKGATMTNAHCNDCGDPIFRYDGQEFCPTCQKPITREQADESAEDGSDGDHIEVANPSEDARVQFGAEAEDDTAATDESSAQQPPDEPTPRETPAETPASADPASPRIAPDETGETATANGVDAQKSRNSDTSQPETNVAADTQPETPSQTPAVSTRTTAPTESPTDDVQANLTEAERLLAQTLRQFAERAAATDNPRRAKEHLEAAREAADALDATSR